MSSEYSNFELHKSKYLKYKVKYINLKNMHGGGVEEDVDQFFRDLITTNPHIRSNPLLQDTVKIKEMTPEETINNLKKKRTKIENGELIWLDLTDLDINVLPASITKLDIKADLYLINNTLENLPENFNTMRFKRIFYYNYQFNDKSRKTIIETIDKNNKRNGIDPKKAKEAREAREAKEAEMLRKASEKNAQLTREAREAKEAKMLRKASEKKAQLTRAAREAQLAKEESEKKPQLAKEESEKKAKKIEEERKASSFFGLFGF